MIFAHEFHRCSILIVMPAVTHTGSRHRMPYPASRREKENLIRCLVSGFCLCVCACMQKPSLPHLAARRGGGEKEFSQQQPSDVVKRRMWVSQGSPAVYPSFTHVTDPDSYIVHYPSRLFVSTLSPALRRSPSCCSLVTGRDRLHGSTETVMSLRFAIPPHLFIC